MGLIDLSDMEKAFIEIMVKDGVTAREAARRAGYKDPSHDSRRLMEKPSVTTKIFERQREELCTWRNLIGMARHTLESKLRDTRTVNTKVVCKGCGEETLHVNEVPIKDTIQLAAARIILQTMAKADAGALVDRASKNDEAESLQSAAERILGKQSPDEPIN